MTEFSALGLIEPLLRALVSEGYETATPIQERAIPILLEGKDVLGLAQTGTGKTAAFVLPMLQKLSENKDARTPAFPRALVLAPTRELATQIAESVRDYGRNTGLRHTVVFGGAPINRQVDQLRRGVDVLVATPGRLLDLMKRKAVFLNKVEFFVLDEADRMLDMGFAPDVRRLSSAIIAPHQTALFSATMPKEVVELANSLLNNPTRVEIARESTVAEKIDQKVLFVSRAKKRDLLSTLLMDRSLERVIVFARTKHGADRVARHLCDSGVRADAIHGDKKQGARQRALRDFRDGKLRALVATDIAARGIDVDGISHVINFDLPNEPESYVHRIGRTARGGASGQAISFCDIEETAYLRAIEKIMRLTVQKDSDHEHHCEISSKAYVNGGKPFNREAAKKRSAANRNGSGAGKNFGEPKRNFSGPARPARAGGKSFDPLKSRERSADRHEGKPSLSGKTISIDMLGSKDRNSNGEQNRRKPDGRKFDGRKADGNKFEGRKFDGAPAKSGARDGNGPRRFNRKSA